MVQRHASARFALCQTLLECGSQPVGVSDAAHGLRLLQRAACSAEPFGLLIADSPGYLAAMGLKLCEAVEADEALRRIPRVLLHEKRRRAPRTASSPTPGSDARCSSRWCHGISSCAPSLGSLLHASTLDGLTPVPPPRSGLLVLLAEDNAINARLAIRLLEKLGHSVRHVTDGSQAVEAVMQTRFDAVLMDMQMPQLDGLEATRRIRAQEHGRRTPVIALTANAMKVMTRSASPRGWMAT